ncbi:MAG: ABC transporter permease [Cyclobacteriaceae bacterium]|nr:ABC transporter permease [Cyclobacteriaceae bacterium]MCB0499720.1 ABC transporter permease [Cyclobacteriaceae bacterium]MCB9238528.1 ABC transporter permease [Flammeovirgaceae bacterium]MCO5272865.1 ABC transporter permease [Cyclobacteriaceae bacterium]MCW5902427.1 ABC transporter permease [Cyclobacteriaceae bacterium]
MVQHYIKILFRNWLKHRSYMSINILGLSTALLVVILAATFLIDEYSYDRFHSKKASIYRLYKKNIGINDGKITLTTETSGMMGPTMARDYPEVKNFTRVLPWFDETVISNKDKNIFIEHPVFVDSTFFEMFDFKLLKGNPDEALVRPSTIVLTASLATKLFGDKNPIGESVIGLQGQSFEVTGVVEDAPVHSHIQFDALMSWSTTVPDVGPFQYDFMNNWLGQTVFTYVELAPKANPVFLVNKLPEMMQKYFPERAETYILQLQPFTDIYLHSGDLMSYAYVKQGNFNYVKVFGFTALFILIIACVNYININTAKATKRAAEIGMRKVLGANRGQLITQFLGESFVITTFSAWLALLMADLLLPAFNSLVGKQLATASLFQLQLLLALVTIILLVTVMAGLYPAFVLSAFRPTDMIMKSVKSKASGHLPRHALTTIQFGISITLIITTFLVFQQTKFLQNKDLGFDKEHVVVMNINNDIKSKYKSFKQELLNYPDILNVSVCQSTVGSGTFGTTVIPEGQSQTKSVNIFRTDANFIETMGIKMHEGRAFNPMLSSDSSALIINKTFAELLGWKNPLAKTIKFSPDGKPYPVIGVTEDFNFEGLNESKVRPIVMYIHPRNFTNVTLRISGKHTPETIAYMQKLWNQYESRFPFSYYFADSWFDNKYKKEAQLLDTITVLSTLSILLACLGLYGLTAFTIEQRSKEIGIRKVFGASISHLTFLLNRKFIALLVLASILAAPLAYYFIQDWLEDFAYHITIGAAPFGAALVLTLVITLFAVSFQTIKAALMNPITTLRSE